MTRTYRDYHEANDPARNATSYLDTPEAVWAGRIFYTGHYWDAFTFSRLEWLYGKERARAITAGRDPAANADLAKWNKLIAGARP